MKQMFVQMNKENLHLLFRSAFLSQKMPSGKESPETTPRQGENAGRNSSTNLNKRNLYLLLQSAFLFQNIACNTLPFVGIVNRNTVKTSGHSVLLLRFALFYYVSFWSVQ